MDQIATAVAAAWPSSTALGRFRAKVALELAAVAHGPNGPHTMLAAKLTSTLRTSYPNLTKEACALCHERDGKLHIKQLLPSSPSGYRHGQDSSVGGNGITFPGDSFMYMVPYPYDACVFLDVAGLLDWHAKGGGPTGPTTPPTGYPARIAGAGTRFGAPRPAPVAKPLKGIDLTGLVPRYGTPGADRESPYCRPIGEENESTVTVACLGGINGFYWPLLDAAHMSFPGTAAASRLRRHLANCLAVAKGDGGDGGGGGGLPRYTIPYRDLAPIVAASQAAAQYPALRTPAALRAFLLHPASAGVFSTTRVLRRPPDPASAVDCVTLVGSALRRSAATGVAAAIAAAWPGSAPLQRLKRAAARLLAGCPTSPAGAYSVNAGPMGNLLKERQPGAYAALGAASGLMARLDEGETEGYLVYVREDGKEGCLRLKLHALCRDMPAGEAGRDLGLGPSATAPPAAAPGGAAGPAPSSAGAQPASGNAMSASGASAPGSGAAGPHAGAVDDPWVFSETNAAAGGGDSFYEGAMEGPYGTDGDEGGNAYDLPGVFGVSANDQSGTGTGQASQPSEPNDPWAKVRAGLTGFTAAPLPPRPTEPAAATHGDPLSSPPMPSELPPQPDLNQHQQFHQQPAASLVMMLPEAGTQWVRSPPEFESMLRHLYAATQVGLAAHVPAAGGGAAAARPERRRPAAAAAFYAPPAAILVETGDGVAALGVEQGLMELPATVYLVDCAALVDGASGAGSGVEGAGTGQGGGSALPGAAAALRDVLESPAIVKVAHGCDQVVPLATVCGASTISQLCDTRVLLRALTTMLPVPLPALPTYAAAAGPLAAVAMSGVAAHVAALRECLGATGLWGDRHELLAALAGRHAAALREELFGVREWASNPTAHEAALVAAARHLPELWAALAGEAVPWVAMSAAATATATALEAARQAAGGGGGGAPPVAPPPPAVAPVAVATVVVAGNAGGAVPVSP